MTTYYNEHDPFAAAWLRVLIEQGHIAPGEVDERSIVDIRPSELTGYTQCHFFAGIGVWSYALRRAGWPDDRPVWTGSCPCQPFSAAGKGVGFDDERHLWPSWFWLIEQLRPAVIFGEQVAAKNADPWVDLVQDDLEAMDYAFGAVPFPAAGIGAPNIRDRLYWTAWAGNGGVGQADANLSRLEGWRGKSERAAEFSAGAGGLVGRLADSKGDGLQRRKRNTASNDAGSKEVKSISRRARVFVDVPAGVVHTDSSGTGPKPKSHRKASAEEAGGTRADDSAALRNRAGSTSRLADPSTSGRREKRTYTGRLIVGDGAQGKPAGFVTGVGDLRPSPTNGIWSNPDWLFCRDGKWRPIEPGTFPLAHGATARVGRLRGYGNAINAEAAVAFIEAACS